MISTGLHYVITLTGPSGFSFTEYDVKYDKKKTEKNNFEKLGEKLDKNIQVINNKVLEDDIYIDIDVDVDSKSNETID